MRNFKSAYRNAADELPKFQIELSRVQDELHHRKMVRLRQRQTMISCAAAVCVFLVCGVGSATAMNYHSSQIQVKNNGFSFSGGEAYMEAVEEAGRAGDAGQGISPAGMNLEPQVSEEIETVSEDVQELEYVMVDETVEYSSVEEFLAQEEIVIAVPDLTWLDAPLDSQNVIVLMDSVIISAASGDKYFRMTQSDVREYKSYGSQSVYMGESVNERIYTNTQGLTYTVFDSEEEGEIIATHAAISVRGRDLTLDFYGFDEAIVENVLDELDLSVYSRGQ